MLQRNYNKSKHYIKVLLPLVLVIILFSSCVTNKQLIDIQTLKPSELKIPNNFNQPIIVASIYKGIEGDDQSLAQAALDSTAALEAAIVLSESLYDSPLFQGISIPVKSKYRFDSSQLILPFKWDKVEDLCSENNADILISLEYIKLTPKLESYPFWDGYSQAYYGSLTMNVYAFWRVYDLNARKVVAEHLHRDTLIWEEYDYSPVEIGYQLPGFFSSASYAGYLTGIEYSKLIAPTWMDEQRVFFSRGSKEMREAAELVSNNEWLAAASYWQKVIQSPNSKPELAAMAAYNLAVANEINGNFDVAIDWIEKSTEFFTFPEQNWYKKILELRIKLLEKL